MSQPTTSPIGKYLRKLRVDRDENGEKMANKIGISRSQLTFVERGKRSLQEGHLKAIITKYSLTPRESESLRLMAEVSLNSIKIQFGDSTFSSRETICQFGRKFSQLTEEQNKRILNILEEIKSE